MTDQGKAMGNEAIEWTMPGALTYRLRVEAWDGLGPHHERLATADDLEAAGWMKRPLAGTPAQSLLHRAEAAERQVETLRAEIGRVCRLFNYRPGLDDDAKPTPEPGEPTLRHAGTEHCNSCGGSGSSPASGDCSACDGTGRRPVTSGVPAETAGEDWGRNCAACGAQWVTGSTINKLSDLVEPYQLKVRELQSALTRAEATLAAREQEGAEARAIKDRLLGSPCRLCDDLEVVQTDQGPALCLCSPKRRAQPPLASSVVADEATTWKGKTGASATLGKDHHYNADGVHMVVRGGSIEDFKRAALRKAERVHTLGQQARYALTDWQLSKGQGDLNDTLVILVEAVQALESRAAKGGSGG